MSDQRVYLDDIYASKESQGSVFRAVVMMAKEARFINDQARQGFIQLTKKPTTIAMYKFKEGKLSVDNKESAEVMESAADTQSLETEQVATESVPEVSADDESVNSAFGE